MGREAGQLNTVARKVVGPLFRGLWRFEVEGLERVPERGPAILTPNHTSVIDSFFLPCVLPRRITYVGKAEYLDDWKTRYLFPALGMIPIDRSGGDSAEAALAAAEAVLRRGELFGIYPEGTRSRSGDLHKGHTGPARLALRTGAPIVPVGLIGTREVQPPDTPLPRPFRHVTIRFGQPIDVSRYRDRIDDRRILRQIIDEVMYEIRELTGQRYVDTYASKPTDAKAAGTELAGESEAMPRRSSAEVLRGTAPDAAAAVAGAPSGEPDAATATDADAGAGNGLGRSAIGR